LSGRSGAPRRARLKRWYVAQAKAKAGKRLQRQQGREYGKSPTRDDAKLLLGVSRKRRERRNLGRQIAPELCIRLDERVHRRHGHRIAAAELIGDDLCRLRDGHGPDETHDRADDQRDPERQDGSRKKRPPITEQTHETKRAGEEERPTANEVGERVWRHRWLGRHRDGKRHPRDRHECATSGPPSHQRARRERRNEQQHRLVDRQQRAKLRNSGNQKKTHDGKHQLPPPAFGGELV
jgi:hypothetical protein